MAAEQLTEKIIADAASRAAAIVAEAEGKAEAALDSARADGKSQLEQMQKNAAAFLPERIARSKSSAEMQVKNRVLAAKQQGVGKVYDTALQKVLESASYKKLLAKMIADNASDGDGVLFAKGNLTQAECTAVIADAQKKCGKKLHLAGTDGAFKGGVMLLGANYDKNITLEAEIAALRAQCETETVKALF